MSLDGRGYSINIIADNAYSYDLGNVTANLGSSLIFNKFSALFGSIASDAEVVNLVVNYSINYANTSASNENILFAPIAVVNNGKISDVTISSTSINFNISGSLNALIGGVAAVNRGTITGCANNANTSYTITQGKSINLGLGGIACINSNNAKITNCFNNAQKSITSVSENSVYLAGIALQNNGEISLCGNDGALTETFSGNSDGYIGGITIYSLGGRLALCYNNASMSHSATNLFVGAIAYNITGGVINTLVDTASQTSIVATKGNVAITDSGTNYSNLSSDAVATSALTTMAKTSGGYTLRVVQNGSSYTASIN